MTALTAVVAVAAPAADRLAPVSGPVPGAVVAAFAIVVAAFPAITAAESLSQVVREGQAVRPRWPDPDSPREFPPPRPAGPALPEHWQHLVAWSCLAADLPPVCPAGSSAPAYLIRFWPPEPRAWGGLRLTEIPEARN